MNNLTTRKIVLGMLMALVLAFSVQGIADALTLSKTSGDLQTKTLGSSFEITFSVGLTKDAAIFKNGKQVDDTNDENRIDSQGYRVFDATDGRTYRMFEAQAQPTGTFYRSEVAADNDTDGNNSVTSSEATYYVDSRLDVVDEEGRAIYRTLDATGNLSQRLRASSTADLLTVAESVRSNYNDEAIAISFPQNAPTTITFELTSSGYPVDDVPNTARSPNDAAAATTASLYEMDPVRGLPSSVTLRCVPSVAGTYEITITDVTPEADFPNDVDPPQSSITFTLYVVDDTLQTTANAIEAIEEAVYFPGETIQLDTYFRFYTVGQNGARTLVEDPANVHLNYQVTEGPGTVYVRTSDRDTTTPTKNLLTSADAEVYLNMGNGRNVVIASIAGQNPVRRVRELSLTTLGQGLPLAIISKISKISKTSSKRRGLRSV